MARGTHRKSPKRKTPVSSPSSSPSKSIRADLADARARADKRKARATKANTQNAARSSTNATNATGATGATGDKEKTGTKKVQPRTSVVEWKKEEWHHLTDSLLTIIEDSPTMKQAFGFDKGADTTTVNSGGKKIADHCESLARKVLIADPSGRWKEGELSTLRDVMKNRINYLKGRYMAYKKKLGNTGAGVDEDEALDIETSNLKQKILKGFPWYPRLHDLMSTSPLLMEKASSNSSSGVDASVIAPRGSADDELADGSEIDDDEKDVSDTDSDITSSPSARHTKRPSTATTSSAPTSAAPSRKRKADSISQSVSDAARADAEARMAVAKVMADGKAARAKTRQIEQRKLEQDRMAFQRAAMESRQKHELEMMEKRLELERLRVQARVRTRHHSPDIDDHAFIAQDPPYMSYAHFPPGGGPNDVIDPNLFR